MSPRFIVVAAAWLLCGIPFGAALAGDISVDDPFARASAGMARVGAAFMTLRNAGSDDKLVSASSPVAEHVELHGHIKDGDVMRMRSVESIDVPAGGSVQLAPGGLHLMLIVGQSFLRKLQRALLHFHVLLTQHQIPISQLRHGDDVDETHLELHVRYFLVDFRHVNWVHGGIAACASEKGLSSETCGRLRLWVTPKSASRSAKFFAVIGPPRSE